MQEAHGGLPEQLVRQPRLRKERLKQLDRGVDLSVRAERCCRTKARRSRACAAWLRGRCSTDAPSARCRGARSLRLGLRRCIGVRASFRVSLHLSALLLRSRSSRSLSSRSLRKDTLVRSTVHRRMRLQLTASAAAAAAAAPPLATAPLAEAAAPFAVAAWASACRSRTYTALPPHKCTEQSVVPISIRSPGGACLCFQALLLQGSSQCGRPLPAL